jgi:hypothetical protein
VSYADLSVFKGISVYNYQNSTWKDFYSANSILTTKKINNISLQNDTLLWIASDSGLYSLSNLTSLKYYSNNIYNIGNAVKRVNSNTNYVSFTSDSGVFIFTNNQFVKLPLNGLMPANFEVTNNGNIVFNDSTNVYILGTGGCDTIITDITGQSLPLYKVIKQTADGSIYLFSERRFDKLIGDKILPNSYWNHKYSNFLNSIASDQYSGRFKNNGFGSVNNCFDGFYMVGSFVTSNAPANKFSCYYNNKLMVYEDINLYKNTGGNSVYTLVNDSFVVKARSAPFTTSSTKDTIFIIRIDKFNNVSDQMNSEMQSLNINKVSTVANIGDLSWDLTDGVYEVPKGNNKNTVFASALWIGGLDRNNGIHVAAQTYRQSGVDFSPGPLDLYTANINYSEMMDFKRIWKVEAWQILEFIENFQNGNVQNGSYIPAEVIISWPGNGLGNKAHKLADFVDVNNDGLYRPLQDGDYPKIYGDQCLFWIMNDTYRYTETMRVPLGIELHCYAYAFYCPDKENGSERALNYTTFYKYKLFNRSTDSYHDMYYGAWVDNDLGNYQDDYVGCYPSYNTAFTYNGDDFDENAAGYGSVIPIQGTLFLNGPVAKLNDGKDNDNNGVVDEVNEKCLLNHFLYYNNDFSEIGNPDSASHYYNYLHSFWKDSTHVVNNGVDGWVNGGGNGPNTDFMFNSLPYQNGWHENRTPSDRRYIASAGPFNLNAGQMVEFDYAYVTSFDSLNTFNSQPYWQTYLNDLDVIKNHFNSGVSSSCYFITSAKDKIKDENYFEVMPNPNNGLFEIKSKFQDLISVYSVDGRLMSQIQIGPGLTKVNNEKYAKGLYIMKSSISSCAKKILIE